MDTNKLTYIIVLNYNSSECTIQCLESLVKLINAKFKIVIVDNFSSDSSIVQIKKWIQNPETANEVMRKLEKVKKLISCEDVNVSSYLSEVINKNYGIN